MTMMQRLHKTSHISFIANVCQDTSKATCHITLEACLIYKQGKVSDNVNLLAGQHFSLSALAQA